LRANVLSFRRNQRLTSGIKIRDIQIGTGPVAERTNVVVVHVRSFLNRGDEWWNTYADGRPAVLDLTKRHAIPGLSKGIEGMRTGGKRELIVSPHLAYGPAGILGKIPANAVLRFEVELLEVREQGAPHPELIPQGKRLLVIHPGEQVRNLARWQFTLREGESVAGVAITHPVAGATWRHARAKGFEVELDSEQVQEVFESVQSTPANHPAACLRNEQMWADSSQKANSITRDQITNALCLTVYVYEREALVLEYGLAETSPVLLSSRFYQIILSAIEPHLVTVAKELKASKGVE
jgi:hypothetical protein